MGFFSPHKRHANKFNYTPRYYDPAKEEREQRRLELRGERRSDETKSGEYEPGQYIRAKREARENRLAQEKKQKNSDKRMNMWVTGLGLILLVIFIYVLVPRIGAIFEMATSDSNAKLEERQMKEYEEFNPYAPIVIVPNDYQEGDEIEIVE
ncbi:MAG: hypothetical protein II274_01925 [Alistipes sp.]|jgi:hypothetical protein|nr:hypothetical protein [Alistipes sp.]